MKKGLIFVFLTLSQIGTVIAQNNDSIKSQILEEVVVKAKLNSTKSGTKIGTL